MVGKLIDQEVLLGIDLGLQMEDLPGCGFNCMAGDRRCGGLVAMQPTQQALCFIQGYAFYFGYLSDAGPAQMLPTWVAADQAQQPAWNPVATINHCLAKAGIKQFLKLAGQLRLLFEEHSNQPGLSAGRQPQWILRLAGMRAISNLFRESDH